MEVEMSTYYNLLINIQYGVHTYMLMAAGCANVSETPKAFYFNNFFATLKKCGGTASNKSKHSAYQDEIL